MSTHFISLVILILIAVHDVSCRCPAECSCKKSGSRKIVTCNIGGMFKIRTTDMDADTHSLIVAAPARKPNNLTIGRIFLHMYQLEEVRITRSNIPAIGDSSFWPGSRLRILDLSNNNLTFLQDSDFNGLKNLLQLDLSDNQIAATPSAPFRHLASLTCLSLARNRLQTLVPRFFYLLPKLEELDLSGNPLGEVDPENLQDVKGLRTLRLANCNLTHLHSVLYQQLPQLEELDLRDNFIQLLAPEEFRHLKSLRVLRLDGNKLTIIEEVTFQGHIFNHLGLSRNTIVSLSPCAFCNASVTSLDLSHNRLASFNSALKSVAHSLQILNASNNRLQGAVITSGIRSLVELQHLDISGNEISLLPDDAFINSHHLKKLNLSFNQLDNLSHFVLQPLMPSLEELDLAFNHFPSLNPSTLKQLEDTADVRIFGNLWSCTKCGIASMLDWVNSSALYNDTCENKACPQCEYPPRLQGRQLHTVSVDELEPCNEPITQSRVLVASSELGVIVGAGIITLILVIGIIIIAHYRRHGAVYYTREDERTYNGMYENLVVGGMNGYDEKPVFYTTLDRIEENLEEKAPFKHG